MKSIDLLEELRKKTSPCENRPLSAVKRWREISRRPVKMAGALGCALALAAMQGAAQAATLTVTGTGDSIAVDGLVTLREAVTSANNNASVNADVVAVGAYGIDTIKFDISGAGVKTITPTTALPDITGPLTIDGYTQPGSSANTLATGDNAVLLIELNGTNAASSGLTITGGGSTIRGLVINRFSGQFTDAGVNVLSSNNVIEGCFIGVDPTGNTERANLYGGGVRVVTGANNLIGGTTPAARNVISGNGGGYNGNVTIDLNGVPPASLPVPTGTLVRGNYIGTNAAGTAFIHDPSTLGSSVGVTVGIGTGTIIGGADADDGAVDGNIGARNLISGNLTGIVTGNYSGADNSGLDATVQGNFIGVNANGTAALGNYFEGINFVPQDSTGAVSITIGGTAAGAGNVISGQTYGSGVYVQNTNLVMQGNRIGTDLAGTLDLGNGSYGVEVTRGGSPPFTSRQVTIGGATPAARNIISGNSGPGMRLWNYTGTYSMTVQGNFIGTQSDGTSALGNDGAGINVQGGPAAIGGTGSGEGNVIAYNSTSTSILTGGVVVQSDGGTAILGNSIFSNDGLGIDLGGNGVTTNDVGDTDSGPNNLQNFPVITGATFTGSNVQLVGTFNSVASTTFQLEFFGDQTADPSGYGEGQFFLGSTDVNTDGSGNATFDVTFSFPAGVQILSATATDPDGNTSEFSLAFQNATPPPASQLLNISTRMQVLSGDNVLIGGFIVTGNAPKRVIVRAIGPALTDLGVAGALMDPTLELNGFDGSVTTNDDWKDDQQAEIEATGLQPTKDAESAIVQTLAPGAYTAIVRGAGGSTGIGLVEAYDLDQPADSKLANISTRGFVDTGDNVMIGGFIIGPEGLGDATVLVRAIGPSLENFGVANALQDPTLELRDGSGTLLTSNDDWKDSQQQEIEATQLEPTDDRESAILSDLAPGAYTAIVRGALDTTGVGLVEVYHLN